MSGQLVKFLVQGHEVRTEGLLLRGLPEVVVEVDEESLVQEADVFLRHVVSYVDSGAVVRAGETLAYGYWLTLFKEGGPDRLQVWEYNPKATDYVRGATLTLRYWRDQHRVCERFGAQFAPPRPDKLVVLSAGVLEGEPVQGIRYRSPEHMSGWWITTDRYNGDVKTLRQDHLYHLTAERPDLAPYLALPCGFRFDFTSREDVWLDEAAASQAP